MNNRTIATLYIKVSAWAFIDVWNIYHVLAKIGILGGQIQICGQKAKQENTCPVGGALLLWHVSFS